MDKNTILGFVLMGIIVVAFTWLAQPTPEQLEAQKRYTDSIATVDSIRLAQDQIIKQNEQVEQMLITDTIAVATDSVRNVILDQTYGEFSQNAIGEEKFITLSNELLTLKFSNKGGKLYEAVLNKYEAYDSTKVTLFTAQENNYGFMFKTNARVIDSKSLYFEPIATDSTVTMRLAFKNGSIFDVRYTLPKNSYMLKMDIVQNGMDKILPSSVVYLDFYWDQTMRRQEKGRMFEERNSALYYKFYGDDVENLSQGSDDNERVTTSLKWIGFKNQFFSSVFIADERFNEGSFTSQMMKDDFYLKKFHAETTFNYDPSSANPAGFSFFLGPNSYPLLKSYDKGRSGDEELDLDQLVPLGYQFFRWINTWIIIPIFTLLGKFFSNYGIIILIMTIFIKLVLFPFTYKSYMSTAKMQVLKPQIEEINAKYPKKEEALERQRATMDLYSKAGVNPMGGCIPMLLQMPILLAMFAFFPSSIELRGESFLWAHDLSSYDSIFSWDTYIPIITPYFGNHISLFCLLMTVTNLLYTKLNMESQAGSQQMPGMKVMMYMMPLMFLVFFNNYASGLSYYYFVSTLITILQTYAFKKFINKDKVLAKLKENQKKPRKKSGFMARLEEAQRQQQAALREQQKNNKRR